jgi:hypothetical protein
VTDVIVSGPNAALKEYPQKILSEKMSWKARMHSNIHSKTAGLQKPKKCV